MRRVVITGIGAITPIGSDHASILEALKTSKCAIGPITNFDSANHLVSLAAEVKDFKPEDYLDKKSAKRMDRASQMGIAAAKKAFEDSKLNPESLIDNTRIGVSLATGIGGLSTIEEEHYRGIKRGF